VLASVLTFGYAAATVMAFSKVLKHRNNATGLYFLHPFTVSVLLVEVSNRYYGGWELLVCGSRRKLSWQTNEGSE
jgi:hypothetical protein